jgi:high-affinity iron transporter
MLSTFLIALREGLEASLIVGMLAAYIIKTDRKHLLRSMWVGVGLAAAISLGFGALLSFTSANLSGNTESYFAGISSLLAIIFVTWMIFWMKRTARNLHSEIAGKVDKAAQMGGLAIALAAFFTVAREGLETSLFLYTDFKNVSHESRPLIGLILGLLLSIALGVAINKKAIKVNLGRFFTYTGSALLIIAAGVFAHGLNEFQNIGILPGANTYLWNWKAAPAWFDSLVDGTFGISSQFTTLQGLAWLIYLVTFLPAYLLHKSSKNSSQKTSA